MLFTVTPEQPAFVLQQDLKTSRGLHEEMKKAASNNAKQVNRTHTLLVNCIVERFDVCKTTSKLSSSEIMKSWVSRWQARVLLSNHVTTCVCMCLDVNSICVKMFYTLCVLIHRWLTGLWRNRLKDEGERAVGNMGGLTKEVDVACKKVVACPHGLRIPDVHNLVFILFLMYL